MKILKSFFSDFHPAVRFFQTKANSSSMITLILVAATLMVVFIVLLPVMSGLTQIEKQKPTASKQKARSKEQFESQGYIPPDELIRGENESQSSFKDRVEAMKKKINVTSNDIPYKIRLQHENDSGLRRRTKEKLDIDTDPNNYDYDVDELIREEGEEAVRERDQEFYKDYEMGRAKEDVV